MSKSEQQYCTESDPDESDSDNSQQDPTFDYLQETRLSFSNLSIKKKPRISKEDDDNMEVDENVDEVVVPELNEIDQKSYETVEKLIKVGQVEKLKVDQCKVYLRKHGLRLTGNKDVLIPRIKEHLEIINGGGERKYPASSFVFNCKGDACTGDIVMFEQNVYEMFNIASRAATGPPCGTRIVAGRIVKESYGAAKQQHTFTIEVLWSRGEKPFPPLHPLLIKGRNLYRLKTYRQRWEDEGQRCKILMEKHARGDAARSNRDVRIHDKEMRKTSKSNRALKTKENRREMAHHVPCTTLEKVIIRDVHYQQENIFKDRYVPPVENNMPKNVMMNTQIPTHPRQPLINMSTGPTQVPFMMPYASSNRLLDRVGSNAYPLVQRPASYHGNANNEMGKKQICRFYPQGRCYFGDNCKYLHDDHSTR